MVNFNTIRETLLGTPQAPAVVQSNPPPYIPYVPESPPPEYQQTELPAENPMPDPELTPVQPDPLPAQVAQTPVQPVTTPPPVQPAPVQQRDQVLYFIKVDEDGTIHQVKTNRRAPVSNTPLLENVRTLIRGPTEREAADGLRSLIPASTRILSADIRNGVASINLSEEFQYNTYGKEGHSACLRQIVWTATEFPSVQEVQILIKGKKEDYLSEGIWIGGTINRTSPF